MANAIFISYRRDDSEGEAGRLFDDLTRAFGTDNVFMDVAGIRPGVDFRTAVEDNVAGCGVLLAVIGRSWASITDDSGALRLANPSDFVALEISSALKRNIPVIPVLVHEAKMPSPDQVPVGLKDFCYRNSVELSHARWSSDVQLLVEALKAYVHAKKSDEQQTVHATVPVQLPAPNPAAVVMGGRAKSKTPMLIAVGVVTVLIVVGVVYAVMRGGSSSAPPAVKSTAAVTAAVASNAAAYIGSWRSSQPRQGNSVDQLIISGSGDKVLMQAIGACTPNPCDWGTQPLSFDGQNMTATYVPRSPSGEPEAGRVTTVSAHANAGNLVVTIANTFTKQAATKSNQFQVTFVPAR